MSGRSSMSSGSGVQQHPADIIDLDRYMRAAIRPGPDQRHGRHCERLVVDAGGLGRKVGRGRISSGSSLTTESSTASGHSSAGPIHVKRFSHDSGLSDGSHTRRRQRLHRRTSGEVTTSRRRDLDQVPGSTASLLAFRAACERALREQQEQIARVAQICERLGEQQSERRVGKRSECCSQRQAERRSNRQKPERSKSERIKSEHLKSERPNSVRPESERPNLERSSSSLQSSDISSSSRSSRSARGRRKDKQRVDECKTYKIIMSKLDELSRLFAAKRPVVPAAKSSKPTVPPIATLSSSRSVSVCDKLVATEPDLRVFKPRHISPTVQILLTPRPTERTVALQTQETSPNPFSVDADTKLYRSGAGATSCRLVVTRANFVEIAPAQSKRPNVTTESVIQRGPNTEQQSIPDKLSTSDLEELNGEAKRLQGPQLTTRRSQSEDRTMLGERFGGAQGKAEGRQKEYSLCAHCRAYWRALRNCLNFQLLCGPEAGYRS